MIEGTNRKFTDEQLSELWERGWSDHVIASILEVALATAVRRRWKLGLIANFRPFGYKEVLTKEEMEERVEKLDSHVKKFGKSQLNPEGYKNYYKNRLKKWGRNAINVRNLMDYYNQKRRFNEKCQCGEQLSPKNKSGLCISCTQKKFTDEQLMELYEQGLNDPQMAEILKVHPPAVSRRRIKLGVMAQKFFKFTVDPQIKENLLITK